MTTKFILVTCTCTCAKVWSQICHVDHAEDCINIYERHIINPRRACARPENTVTYSAGKKIVFSEIAPFQRSSTSHTTRKNAHALVYMLRITEARDHCYCSKDRLECIVNEAGPRPWPLRNRLSAGLISWANKATVSERCLSSLWHFISWSLLLSLHFSSHPPLRPRMDSLFPFMYGFRHPYICKAL